LKRTFTIGVIAEKWRRLRLDGDQRIEEYLRKNSFFFSP